MVDFDIANSSKILMLFIFSFWKKVSSQIPLLSSHPCPPMVNPHGGPSYKIHEVLHRLQNKEKPMQNNFEAPVWTTQNGFRVQHCMV